MISRIEEKILCTQSEKFELFSMLVSKGLKLLHPPRTIASIYFDNNSLQMYSESEEGCVPRKKIRIREYPNFNKKKQLEIKTSSIEGRFKSTKIIEADVNERYLKYGYFDNSYGVCLPKVFVKYTREYYSIDGVRITFDSNIIYNNFTSKKNFLDTRHVIELKADSNYNSDYLSVLIEEPRKRFSKYWNAVNFCLHK